MDSLSKLNQVAHLLRHRLAKAGTPAQRNAATAPASTPVRGDLKQVISARVSQLKADGAEPRQLKRAVIASILQDSFDTGTLAFDADYQQLVEMVCDALESDAELAATLDALIDH